MSKFNDELINKIIQYKEEKNISFKELGKRIGIAESTLAEYKSKKYKGNIEKIEVKIEAFFTIKRAAIRRIDFTAETKNRQKVYDILNLVQEFVSAATDQEVEESAKIGLITGRAGLGKTKGVKEYIKDQPNCYMISAENGDTEKDLLFKIAHELHINTHGTKTKLRMNIKHAIRGREMLLIIDEAEHLRPRIIDIVRSIVDQTGTGLILVGTEVLKNKLISQKNEYEYLYSRIVAACDLDNLNLEDITLITSTYLEGEEEKYTKDEINKLAKTLKEFSKGSARNLSNLITNSMRLVRMEENFTLTEGKLVPDFIKAAATKVIIRTRINHI